ncbi:MAG: hypothetical protein R3F59_30315 [Myxococcota bacterium]
MSLVFLALACAPGGDPDRTAPPAAPPAATALSPLEVLVRASVDARGVRPTPDEVAAVQADPSALEPLIDGFLDDPRLEDRLVALYQEAFLTKMEDVGAADYYAVHELVPDVAAFAQAVGEEPLRIMAHIGLEDLPYDLAVTGDFTVVDDDLGALFPTDRPADARGWTVAHYTDGRPPAGVLATNGLWWRYPSTASNKQRKRGNTVSKLFVCRDFLATPVVFDNDVDLLDEDALADAIRTNDSCRTCHDALEPISSWFWGFDFAADDGFPLADALRYHPERERRWADETGVAPGWFGTPGDTLEDLGRALTRDPAFDPCAVQHLTDTLLRRTPGTDAWTEADDAAQQVLVRDFRTGGRTIRAIWRGILQDPRYRGVVDPATGTVGVQRKLMTPDLLRSVVLDLTGFDWVVRGEPVLDREDGGLATLAGGIDGRTVTRPATQPNTTVALVQARLAAGAAAYAVAHEAGLPDRERRLFAGVALDDRQPGEPAVRDGLAGLVLQVTSRPVAADDPEIDALLGLWDEVRGLDPDPAAAWSAALAALLRDPAFVLY